MVPRPSAVLALLTAALVAAPAGSAVAAGPEFASPRTISVGAANPRSVAAADLDGDGRPDLAVGADNGTNGRVSVLRNTGGGRFGAIPGSPFATGAAGSGVSAVAAGDLSGDGRADVVATADSGAATNLLALLLGDGTGRVGAAPGAPFPTPDLPRDVALADVDADGDLDTITAHDGLGAAVLVNDGDGGLTAGGATTPLTAVALAAGDLDGDLLADALLVGSAGGTGFAWVATSDGAGGLSASAPVAGVDDPVDVALGDLDGDGDLDAALAGRGALTVLRNDGGTFTAAPVSLGGGVGTLSGVTIADVDGDAVRDVVVTDGQDNEIGVLRNDGAGGLAAPTWLAMGSGARSPLALDVDGDAVTDLVTANAGANTVSVRRGTGLPLLSFAGPGWFGERPVGSTGEPRTVTITNQGAALLRVTSVGVLGPGADDFLVTRNDCTGTDVPAGTGASCLLHLRFAPSELGSRSATLRLTHAAGVVDVPLDGTGIEPPVPALAADPAPAPAAETPAVPGDDGADVVQVERVGDGDTTTTDDVVTTDDDGPALTEPAALRLTTREPVGRAGRPVRIAFAVGEPASVTLRIRRGTKVVATVRATVDEGRRALTWNGRIGNRAAPVGTYRLSLRAITPDGRISTAAGTLRVRR